MGCFSKFFLFALNFAIFGIGVAVIVLASLILSQTGDFQALLDQGTFTIPIIFLLIGIAVMLLGFFGCFGALRESPCLLYTYATIVLLLFTAQVAIVIYGLVQQDEIKTFLQNSMTTTFNKYGTTEENTKALDQAQESLKCCGIHNYTDWYTGVITPALSGDVAAGCCKDSDAPNCNVGISSLTPEQADEKIYTKGCYTLLIETVENEALWLIIGGSILAIVQLASITIACGIGRNSRPSSNVY